MLSCHLTLMFHATTSPEDLGKTMSNPVDAPTRNKRSIDNTDLPEGGEDNTSPKIKRQYSVLGEAEMKGHFQRKKPTAAARVVLEPYAHGDPTLYLKKEKRGYTTYQLDNVTPKRILVCKLPTPESTVTKVLFFGVVFDEQKQNLVYFDQVRYLWQDHINAVKETCSVEEFMGFIYSPAPFKIICQEAVDKEPETTTDSLVVTTACGQKVRFNLEEGVDQDAAEFFEEYRGSVVVAVALQKLTVSFG